MARYHGKSGAVYLSTSGTGTPAAVVSLSSWSLEMATDKQDVTSFQDTNKTYVQGLKDIKGKIAGFWDSSADTLFTAAASTDGIKMYLYPSTDAATKYWYGPAWLDASIETAVDGAVKVTADFVANGSWGSK